MKFTRSLIRRPVLSVVGSMVILIAADASHTIADVCVSIRAATSRWCRSRTGFYVGR